MAPTRALPPHLVYLVLLAAACQDPAPAGTEGATGTSGSVSGSSSTSDGSTSDGGTSDGGTSAGTDTDPAGECSFEITPEGGSVSACGVRFWSPPGAVAAVTPVVVTQPAIEASVFDGLARTSPIVRLEAEDPNLELAGYATLHIPQAAGDAAVWMARHFEEFGAWGVLETCWRDAESAGIRTTRLGTFTALEDLVGNDNPGAGSISAAWDTRMEEFSLVTLGHADSIPTASGARSIDLYGVTTAGGDPETLKLSFTIDAMGVAGPALVTMMVVDQGVAEGWIDWDGVSPPSDQVFEVDEPMPNHLVGSLSATLYRDDGGTWAEMHVDATFEADVARHFLPSEDPCPIP